MPRSREKPSSTTAGSTPGVVGRLGAVRGAYLQGTWVAILSCSGRPRTGPAKPILGGRHPGKRLLAGSKRSSPGRLVMGPEDLARCLDDPRASAGG